MKDEVGLDYILTRPHLYPSGVTVPAVPSPMHLLNRLIGPIKDVLTPPMTRHADNGKLPDAQAYGNLVRRGTLVALRHHIPDNRSSFIDWYQDREIAEMLRHDLEPLTEFQARTYFDTIILPQSSRGTCWALHLVQTGALIGSTAVTDIDSKRKSCLFRIVIGDKTMWGRGLGTEATRLVAAEAFETLGLESMNLEVFTHNERALGAYRRVGFRETGRHVEWVPQHHRHINVIEMALKRSDAIHRDGAGG